MCATRFLLSLTASLTLSAVFPSDDPALERRLDQLAASLEAAHVPGMSIAIVKDDALVWARGFGLADVDAGRAAGEDTLYAIGSTTKAFTATLVVMLVDEGKAGWDLEFAEEALAQLLPFPMVPIDHVLLNSDLIVGGVRVGPHVGSDHRPMLVQLQVRKD